MLLIRPRSHSRLVPSQSALMRTLLDAEGKVDYEQSLIFLRDSRVGEHASARENHFDRDSSASRLLVGGDSRALACTRLSGPEKNEGLLVVYKREGGLVILVNKVSS